MKNIYENLDDSYCKKTGKLLAKRVTHKLELDLLCLLRSGEKGLNQPEANFAFGESCLHTSVSTLQNNYSVNIERRSEPWRHRHGAKTHFMRYWLADEIAELKAVALLNSFRFRRGMYPIQPSDYFNLPNKVA